MMMNIKRRIRTMPNNNYPNVKKVNIIPSRPITSVNPPIRSAVRRVYKTLDEIRQCMISRAVVQEILEDGSVLVLDFSNYASDNRLSTKQAAIDAAKKKAEEQRAAAIEETKKKAAEEAAKKKAAEEQRAAAERKAIEETKKKAAEEAAKKKEAETVKTNNIEDNKSENTTEQ
jgi:ribosomal protein L14E/L6E/L27E